MADNYRYRSDRTDRDPLVGGKLVNNLVYFLLGMAVMGIMMLSLTYYIIKKVK